MATSPIDAESSVGLPCPWLPDDIVENIFARLPAKFAGRCRCLSRAWAATLSSDDFVDRHHRLANCRRSPRVFFLHYSFHDGPQMCVWSQDRPTGASSLMHVPRPTNGNTLRSTDEGQSTSRTIPGQGPVFQRQFPLLIVPFVCRVLRYVYRLLDGAPARSYGPLNRPCLVGQSRLKVRRRRSYGGALRLATLQCRGLVILQDFGTKTNYMFNPSTGQMAALPQGLKEDEKTWHENVWAGRYTSLGLGYDIQTKKHKVVRIYYEGNDLQGLPRCAGCEVYVVNCTGHWLLIKENPPAQVKYNRPSVFLQGHMHWLAQRKINISDDGPVEMVVLSFSLADHTFGIVAPPLGMESEILSMQDLTKLDGQLCLFSYNVSRSSCYDIWLLPDHGARVWNLRCRIDLTKVSPDITDRFVRCYLHPLAIVNNGSRILLVQPRVAFADRYSRLCAYDPVTGDIEDIFSGSNMVYDHDWIMGSIDAAVYEESIISFG